MGCDIHLKIETRRRRGKEPSSERQEWCSSCFSGEFNSRNYGMFARMAGVRDYGREKNVYFEPRGIPDDIDWLTMMWFVFFVVADEAAVEWGRNYCFKENAEKWVESGYSKWIEKGRCLTNPDLHTFSWLTTKELRECFDDCFKGEDKLAFGYIEWLGLVSLCEGIEADGNYECRVVFAFDN